MCAPAARCPIMLLERERERALARESARTRKCERESARARERVCERARDLADGKGGGFRI